MFIDEYFELFCFLILRVILQHKSSFSVFFSLFLLILSFIVESIPLLQNLFIYQGIDEFPFPYLDSLMSIGFLV